MSPYGSIALGLGLVLVDVSIDGFDLVPDAIGWLFVAGGVHALSSRHRAYAAGRALAIANAVLAVVTYVPATPSAATLIAVLADLGALAFVLALCTGLIATEDARTARRATAIRWLQIAATVATVVLLIVTGQVASFGSEADPGAWWPLAVLAIVMGVGSNLWLVVLLLSLRQRDPVEASASPSA